MGSAAQRRGRCSGKCLALLARSWGSLLACSPSPHLLLLRTVCRRHDAAIDGQVESHFEGWVAGRPGRVVGCELLEAERLLSERQLLRAGRGFHHQAVLIRLLWLRVHVHGHPNSASATPQPSRAPQNSVPALCKRSAIALREVSRVCGYVQLTQ